MQHMVELEDCIRTYTASKIYIRAGLWVVGNYEGTSVSGLSLAHVLEEDKRVLALYSPEDGTRPLEIFIESPTKYPASQDAWQNLTQLYQHGYQYHPHDRFRKSVLRAGLHTLQDIKQTVVDMLRRSKNNRPKFQLSKPAPELEI